MSIPRVLSDQELAEVLETGLLGGEKFVAYGRAQGGGRRFKLSDGSEVVYWLGDRGWVLEK